MPLFKQLRRVCLFAVKCGENVLYGCRGSYIFEHIHAFDISLIENFLTKIMFFWKKMYSTCYQMNREKGLVKSILSKKVIRFCATSDICAQLFKRHVEF